MIEKKQENKREPFMKTVLSHHLDKINSKYKFRQVVLLLIIPPSLLLLILFLKVFLSQKQTTNSETLSSSTYIPLAVGSCLGDEWFSSWARTEDIFVVFGLKETFDDIPSLTVGKVGWNVPSLSHAVDTEKSWLGKVDTIIYDHELWDKTPLEEKENLPAAIEKSAAGLKQDGVELIVGASWKSVLRNGVSLSASQVIYAQGNIDWDAYIDKEMIYQLALQTDNFGVNATGLRSEFPESYVSFFKSIAKTAREANPDIKLWPVLDARTASSKELYQMMTDLNPFVDGVTIMGCDEQAKSTIEEFISLIREAR
ncbi:MAG: hypothetical protein ABIE03_05465 [Patescibacteria group bacterium]|nr:hypothetical protein [Patescibacteria group bacterium]